MKLTDYGVYTTEREKQKRVKEKLEEIELTIEGELEKKKIQKKIKKKEKKEWAQGWKGKIKRMFTKDEKGKKWKGN